MSVCGCIVVMVSVCGCVVSSSAVINFIDVKHSSKLYPH